MYDLGLILEATMIILFGISWPLNIIKSIKSKTARGKSLYFLIFIEAGYLCGILSKFITGNVSWVIIFYSLNLVMVATDIVLYFINRRRDKQRDLASFQQGLANM